jgi:hypothetical protein
MYGNIVTPPLWPTFILHHIAKSHAVIGLPNNEWSDQAFAFKGDLVHGQLPSIYWDPLHLNHQVPGQQRVQISDAPTQHVPVWNLDLSLMAMLAWNWYKPTKLCMYHPAMNPSSWRIIWNHE